MRAPRNLVKEVFDKYSSRIPLIREHMPLVARSVELSIDELGKYMRAGEAGEPTAWINFAVPTELFVAMDIPVQVYDGLSAHAARFGYALEYIDIAEQHIPDHICSDNKVHLGMVLSGDIPPPTVMVYPSSPCDSNRAVLSAMAKYFDIPSFCIDLPYFKSERGFQYVAGQLKQLISFLEKETNRKLDIDRLRQTMEYSNQAHELYLKIDKLRQAVPCPYSSLDMYMDGGMLVGLAGIPELVDYYRTRYEDTREKVAKGEGHLADEKIRLVWTYGVMVEDVRIYLWLEQTYGAVSVCAMNFNWAVKPTEDLSTLDSMLRGLAEKSALMPMNREVHGPMENYIDATVDMCRRFKADAGILTGHVACKSNWAVMKLMKDRIEEELGIHMLVFEVDLFDPRLITADGVKAKIEDFMETVVIPRMNRKD